MCSPITVSFDWRAEGGLFDQKSGALMKEIHVRSNARASFVPGEFIKHLSAVVWHVSNTSGIPD